jgi:hypothetical protein
MKKLQLEAGGVPRKNDTLVHLQSGLTESLTAMCTAFLTHNTATAVVLHGCEFSASTGIANMTTGSIFADGEICKVQAVNGLDMSLNIYFEKSTGYLPPLLYADSQLKYTYNETVYNVYAAASKNDPADLQIGVEVVRFDTAMKNVVNFDNGAFLSSVQPAWQLVVPTGNVTSTGWVIQYPFKYRIDQVGTVHLTTVLRSLPSPNFSPVIEFLPVGLRPTQREMRFLCPASATYSGNWRSNKMVEVVIGTDGRIAVENYNLDITSYFVVELHLSFTTV